MLANIYGEDEEFPDLIDLEIQENRMLYRKLQSNVRGNQGEKLVDIHLSKYGHTVFMAPNAARGLDMRVDLSENTIGGLNSIRVQVKSTIEPVTNLVHRSRLGRIITSSPHYKFDTHKKIGSSGRRCKLTSDDCDIVAFVCLDTETIDFLNVSEITNTNMNFYLTNHRGGNKTNVIGTHPLHLLFDKVENA